MKIYICFFILIFSQLVQSYERIVSINLCTDQLLYLLEDKENIQSVSFLSADPDYSPYHQELSKLHLNHAQVEEIIPLEPDLILAGNYTDIHTVNFLRNLGYQVEQVDIPWNMEHIEETILHVGKILNREEKARLILENMNKRKQSVRNRLKEQDKPLALILAPNGFTHGKGSMKGDLLELAQFENLASSSGIQGSANIHLETVIRAQPEYIIIEDSASEKNSLAQRFLQHPALQKALPNTKRIHVHPNLWTCGSASMIDALEILAAAHPSQLTQVESNEQ